jgi:UDP-glucuronate 4-epimerase
VKVLVTGCHGFLGHHVCAQLLEKGHQVVGVDRITGARSPKANRIAAFAKFGKACRFIEGDLASWAFTRKMMVTEKPRAVFHAAGQYSVKYTTENLQHYITGNLVAPLYLLEAAALSGVFRVVYASSQAISDQRQPSGLYGATKGFGEEAAYAYWVRKGISTVGLRYGVLYGPMIRPDTEFHRTVAEHLAGLEAKPGSQFDKLAPLIEIQDAAEIAVRALEANQGGPHVIPAVANDVRHSYRDVLEAAAAITGRPARAPTPAPQRGPRSPMDQHATRQLLGWVPSITLAKGMGRYLEWAKQSATTI